MVAFNADYPDVPGVYYASYAGKSCGALDLVCQWSNKGEVVDLVFTVSHAFITLAAGDNDGMVPVESAKWGDYRGTIPADHMDEVGQIADFFNLSFDHKDFYLEELRRLAELGL
jgi:triacylglycerol lipase